MLLTNYRLGAYEKAAIGPRALLALSLALYVVFVGASSLAAPTAESIPTQSNYHVLDLSWTGVNHGWALVEGPCGIAQCEELLVSTDGIHWASAGPVPARSTAGQVTSIALRKSASPIRTSVTFLIQIF